MTPADQLLYRQLTKMGNVHLSAKAVRMLYAVKLQPGCMGVELTERLHIKTIIHKSVMTLIRKGFLEDRRPEHLIGHPNSFYLTEKGETLLRFLMAP